MGFVLYFDRSLGKAVPEALRILGVQNVLHHHSIPSVEGIDEKGFPQDAPDDEWLAFAGQRGWVSFSQDCNMHREPAALDAIRTYQAKVFYLWGASAPKWDKMRTFAKAYDAIIEKANKLPGPFVCRVMKDGNLKDVNIRA